MNKPILVARNIHKSYRMGRADVRVLRGASLTVADGEFLVVMGSSGSGKSTLLHILGALDAPDDGSVQFRGQTVIQSFPRSKSGRTLDRLFGGFAEYGLLRMALDPSERQRATYRNRDVGFVFQFYHLLPELTVLENVLMARMIGRSFLGWRGVRVESRNSACEILDRVGLQDRIRHRPSELSGGERQRAAIARALVNQPALLLADEPTGNLDEATGAGILRLLTELNAAGQTIVMVTHDAKVASLADRRVQLSDGVVREMGDAPDTRQRLSKPASEVA